VAVPPPLTGNPASPDDLPALPARQPQENELLMLVIHDAQVHGIAKVDVSSYMS
jgi:hypothetical protein